MWFATTACNCLSLIWPAGSAPAALASLLFDPPEPQTIGKRGVSWLSYLFARLDLLSSETFSFLIFFLLLFSSLTVHISAFHLSMLSEICLLNFLRQLQLHYTTTAAKAALQHTIHPAVVGEVTAATIATTPKNTTPTSFRSISGFALPSMHHNNSPLLYVSHFWNFRHRLMRCYW